MRRHQDGSAERRFHESAAARASNAEQRRTNGTGLADTVERLQARVRRLEKAHQLPAGAAASATAESREVALQRLILASSSLQSWTFLPRGARAARSVARICETANGRDVPIGTGFLVAPDLLMTNNHVLPLEATAAEAVVELGVELDVDNRPQLPVQLGLDPGRLFVTDVDLDLSLVATTRTADGQQPGDVFGWCPLIPAEGKIVTGEALNVVGHPAGRPKEIAIRHNELLVVLPQFLHYSSDTQRGSSGSPVFNDQWEMVALHHAAVPDRDDRGRILRRDGRVWHPGDGQDAVRWIANEGARVSAIVDLLTRRGVDVPLAPPNAARDPHPAALV